MNKIFDFDYGKLRWILLFVILLLLCIFLSVVGFNILDPDFGWHVKLGELILSHGIPKTDPFSYTMPSWHFIDHEWLSNILIYLGNQTLGRFGLAFIFSLLIITSPLIVIFGTTKKYLIIGLILSVLSLLAYSGVRTQVESWFMFSILLKILLEKNLYNRFKFLIPLLMIVWVNLHGGFAIGIATLGWFVLVNIWENKKINLVDGAILLLSIIATLINPFGVNIWGEIWLQMSDNNLRWTISEWTPLIFRFDLGFVILFSLSVILLIKFWKKFSLFEKSLYIILLLAGLSSQRQTPFWVLTAVYILIVGLKSLEKQVENTEYGRNAFRKSLAVLITAGILVFIGIGVWAVHSSFNDTENAVYPTKAIQFLKSHPPKGQVFSDYNWGGYLIWKYPEKKVFIDGRMPSWRRNIAPPNESKYAFIDYRNALYTNENLAPLFKKYNIQTVLWHAPESNSSNDSAIQNFTNDLWNKFLNLFNNKTTPSNQKDFITRIKILGFKKVYQDNISVIYESK